MQLAEISIQSEPIPIFVPTPPQPRGCLGERLLEQEYCRFSPPFPFKSLDKTERKLREFTQDAFNYGVTVSIPEIEGRENNTYLPMLYINDEDFGIPTREFEDLDGLVVFDHDEVLSCVLNQTVDDRMQDNKSIAYILPGGGGRYLMPDLEAHGVSSDKFIQIGATRQWVETGDIDCSVDSAGLNDDSLNKLAKANKWVFVDDVICTGSTIAEVVRTLIEFYDKRPDIIQIAVEALASVRCDEPFIHALREIDVSWEIYAGIIYGGFSKRPRLLTNRGIMKGREHPERFARRGYPEELLARFAQ